tara:strand:+ start:5006 stop:6373 length:1368 start_codon:yes stop_codon:yes gene_type:complete
MKINKLYPHLIRNEQISGWGNTNKIEAKIIKPQNIKQIQNIVKNSNEHSLITRGLGRSYGDAAQLKAQTIVDLNHFKSYKLYPRTKEVAAGSGLTFSELLQKIVQKGFFLPVAPGTKNITVGGAVASDVHGKNHHSDGSFGNHVKGITLIDGKGNIQYLSKTKNPNLFWATIGGMGLTGIIIEVTFSLIRINTSLISVDTQKHKDIDSLMASMIEADKKYKYSVAWIDCFCAKGRGILTCGEHLDLRNLEKKKIDNHLSYKNNSFAKVPQSIPNGILNQFTGRAFNEAWFRKTPNLLEQEPQTIGQYFYPLDGIDNWNNIYGSKGFIQYQFVIPDQSSGLLKKILDILRKNSVTSFLTVLKRFGDSNLAPISFPQKGWTLAIDIPSNVSNIFEILDNLDELVASANGKIYLSKDSRMSAQIFKSTYSRYREWREVKDYADPKNIFYSDLAQRLQI